MLTAGDIQVELTAGAKIFVLTTSMFVLKRLANLAVQAEIIGGVMNEINRGSPPSRKSGGRSAMRQTFT